MLLAPSTTAPPREGVHATGEIFREVGDRHGEGMAGGNLGLALQAMGRLEEAIAAYRRNVVVCRELGDGYGQTQALDRIVGCR